jgi:hypothetical protein
VQSVELGWEQSALARACMVTPWPKDTKWEQTALTRACMVTPGPKDTKWEQTALARAYSSERRRGPQASRAARVHDAVRLELSQKTAQSEEHW